VASEHKPPRLHLRLFMFAMLGLLLSCANAAYSRAYHEALEREVDGYRYQGSLQDLHRDIATYLSSTGYVPVVGSLATVETEWRPDAFEGRERIRVELGRHPDGLLARVFVVVEHLSPQQYTAHSLERETEFERELHELLVPDVTKRGDPATFVYERPAQEIWDEATRLAFNRPATHSFQYSAPPVDAVAVSEWREFADEGERTRLEIRLRKQVAGKYVVEASERVERASGERTWQAISDERDRTRELELIRSRDPLHVQKIETEAQAAGSAAYNEAIDNGAIACQCAI
jgi:hypothetical protein